MDDKQATRPAGDGKPITLHTPLSSASAADNGPWQPPFEHHWSVLTAILLIVVAVTWSLLRQNHRN